MTQTNGDAMHPEQIVKDFGTRFALDQYVTFQVREKDGEYFGLIVGVNIDQISERFSSIESAESWLRKVAKNFWEVTI